MTLLAWSPHSLFETLLLVINQCNEEHSEGWWVIQTIYLPYSHIKYHVSGDLF
jgi:hypothetical protein